MKLETAQRKRAKIKLGLQGASGGGKTYSALLLAYGLCNDWKKIAVIDTENRSADLYSDLGTYNVLPLQAPFEPEKYIEAIQFCEKEGIEVIIVDSASHEWSGKGGCLEQHEKEISKMRYPNSFTAWAAITPRHQAFVDAVLHSACHVICTFRSKSEYVLVERNGKTVPQKVGLSPITRDGFEFELTLSFDLDLQHKAHCSKDRTHMFMDKEPVTLSVETGRKILDWCNSGVDINTQYITERIEESTTEKQLYDLWDTFPQFQEQMKPVFEQRKKQILKGADVTKQLSLQKSNTNGTHK